MALINCDECNNQISNRAESCPHCGVRLVNNNTTIANPYKGKLKIVIGKVLLILGVLMLFSGIGQNSSVVSSIGVIILIIGFVILIAGRFQNWWHWR